MPVVLSGLGTVTPLATVTIRSQVSGYLTQIGFREGQTVKAGDFLAQIDVRPYEALLAQYQGQLLRDQALLQNARLDLARYQTLNRQDSISKQNVDTQAATVKQYEGIVASDQAHRSTSRSSTSLTAASPRRSRAGWACARSTRATTSPPPRPASSSSPSSIRSRCCSPCPRPCCCG